MEHVSSTTERRPTGAPADAKPTDDVPADAKPSTDLYAYCSEPSTSGCSTKTSRKRTIWETDDSSDSVTSGEASKPAEETIFEQLTRRRRYRLYEKIRDEKQIVVAPANLNSHEETMVNHLMRSFNVSVLDKWDDSVTHLVVHAQYDGAYIQRSAIYIHALLSHCFIVSADWVKECLLSGYLVPEFEYIVKDKNSEPNPYISWRVGRGIMESPMQWAAYCKLFFYGFDHFDDKYLNAVNWAKKVGFAVAGYFDQLNDEKFTFRIVLTSQVFQRYGRLPSETRMIAWICEYKAITVHLDWLLKCLYEYKFHPVDKVYQVLELDEDMKDFTETRGFVC